MLVTPPPPLPPSRHKTLKQSCFNVVDDEPTLNQQWFKVLCLLGYYVLLFYMMALQYKGPNENKANSII